MIRIAIDYTTGIYPGAGVARSTRSLVDALAHLDSQNRYTLFYAARGLPRPTPETARAARLFREHPNFKPRPLPFSVRQMFALWQRLRLPLPTDIFTGPCDVVHSPDFVSPPHLSGADVITVHDLSFLVVPEYAEPRLAAFLGKSVPAAVRRARRIIAVSEQTKRDLVRLLHAPPGKIVVAHNGVEARFRPLRDREEAAASLRRKLNLPARFILHVGTLEPRKNLARLVQAYSTLGRGQEIPLVLAGRKGWLYEPILGAAEEANRSGGRVQFVDFVDDEDLPLLYNMAEVFAYPSLYEGFGLPAAEAMACGTPTLVSTDGALAEVVGRAAVKVDPLSTESIAGGLRSLLDDAELRRRLSKEGPEQVAQFTWDAAAQRVLAVYREITSTEGKAARR